MSDPAVSVIMPTYNGSAHLRETLEALAAQRFQDWELVAVDDGSRDDTVALLRGFGDPRVRVIESSVNGGPVIARNIGFAHARGRYVAALDQDDLPLPERLGRQVAFLDARPDVVLVSTATDLLEDGRIVSGHWPARLAPVQIDWLLLIRNPFVWSSVMFRADAARRLQPFERPEMRYVEDFDLYHRLRRFGRLAQLEEVLTIYRSHDGGASTVFNATMLANAQVLLSERHGALLGPGVPDISPLLMRHVMAREPVPDAATLEALFQGIAALRAAFEAQGAWTRDELALVDGEISRLWWDVCRAGVRSGAVGLPRALAGRPGAATWRDGHPADLMVSQMIGGVRALRRAVTG